MTPTSKELIEMADTEWKNREERKGIHDRISWTAGWISGYLAVRGEKPSCKTDMVQLYKGASATHKFPSGFEREP